MTTSLARAARRIVGLFALESRPLYLRLAARGTLGLMGPLLLGRALGEPTLGVVGLTAFLLAFGDLSEDRGWLARLAAGGLIGGIAVATGVLLGAHPLAAALGMLAWGAALGLAGAYGDGAAAMALPIAWMFLEVGLAAPVHSLGEAARLGGLVAAGGAWAVALAWASRRLGPEAPLATQTARCFAELADYLDHALALDAAPEAPTATDGYGPSRETRVRSAIADARGLALDRRREVGSTTHAGQRLVMLIELADRAFALGCVLEETRRARREIAAPGIAPDRAAAAAGHALFPGAAREVARLLAGRDGAGAEARIESDLRRFEATTAGAQPDERAEIRGRLATALALALRAVVGQPVPAPPQAGDPGSGARAGRSDRDRWIAPLRATLDRDSVVGRHALRYGIVTAIAVAIDKSLGTPFAYWIPLTVTVVLKPYTGSTLTRAEQRLASTVGGATIGVLLLQVVAPPAVLIALVAAAFFASLAVLSRNYGVAILFLTIGVVPFESLLGGETSWRIGLLRIAYTCTGGALALAAGYLLWPSFERRSLPALMSATIASLAAYADRVLAVPAGDAAARDEIEPAHRRAGVDTTNLQASFQRVIAESGADRARLEATLLAVVTLQRLMVSINALRELGPAATPGGPEWGRLRALVARGLSDLPAAVESGRAPAAMPGLGDEGREIAEAIAARPGRYDELLAREVERISWQLSTLRAGVRAGVR